MKRDWNVLRWILSEVETCGGGYPVVLTNGAQYSSSHYSLNIGERNFEEVCEQALLLKDAGLAEVRDLGRTYQGPVGVAIDRLTMLGHNFLELACDETRWQQAIKTISEKGGTVEDLMKVTAVQTPSFGITVVAEPFGYVSAVRIQELKEIKSERVDLTKLIRLCEELNIAHANNLNLAVAMLLRSVLDHVPPVFSKASFKEVASGYGGKSFKDTMQHLENGARKIADSHLHVQIRKKEVLPTSLQVNFSPYLDVLLAEVIAVLQS
jgi:hypothetical protein